MSERPNSADLDSKAPARLSGFESRLLPISGIMLRSSLAELGLYVPANATVAEIRRAVTWHIEEGGLTEAQAHEMALDCVEHSNKHVYMFDAAKSDLAKWTPSDPARVVGSRSAVRFRASTKPDSVLQYIWSGGQIIQYCFTETHTDYEYNKAKLRIIPRSSGKVVVLTADKSSGSVTLMMDPPGADNPHGSKLDYYRAYADRIPALLGAPVLLTKLASALTKLEKEKVLEIVHSRAVTAGGKISITGIGVSDIRDHPEFPTLSKGRVTFDEDDYLWLPQTVPGRADITMPLRPVRTRIAAPVGEVRFSRHAIASEILYVLGKLRKYA